MNKYISEMIGTMILVLTGCGSIVFAGNMPGTVSTGGCNGFRAVGGCLGIRLRRNIRMSYKSGDHAGGVLLGKNGW